MSPWLPFQIVVTNLAVFGVLCLLFGKPEPECPPYWKCTPKAEWFDPNCKCWDRK